MFPETGCITIMKAMASGTIPITSKYSLLQNLTGVYDLGPTHPIPSLFERIEHMSNWTKSYWVPAVVAASTLNVEYLRKIRKEMKSFAKSSFRWEKSTDIFLADFLSQ